MTLATTLGFKGGRHAVIFAESGAHEFAWHLYRHGVTQRSVPHEFLLVPATFPFLPSRYVFARGVTLVSLSGAACQIAFTPLRVVREL